jgi:hypothetical protein
MGCRCARALFFAAAPYYHRPKFFTTHTTLMAPSPSALASIPSSPTSVPLLPSCGSCATPTRRPGTTPRPRLPHCNRPRALTHLSSSPTPCLPWPLPPHAPRHSSTPAHVTPTRQNQLPSNPRPPTHRVIPLIIIRRGRLSGCHLPIHYASKVGSHFLDALPPTSLFLGHTCPSIPPLRTASRCPRRTTGSCPCGRTRWRRPWCWPRRSTTSSRAR